MEFKPIEFPFTRKGFIHELVKRQQLICIVRRHTGAIPAHFEVIRLRQRPKSTFRLGSREISAPAMECYPSDKDWGIYGFSYRELESAQTRFDALLRS